MALKPAWTNAPVGRMPPIEQAKLWAVRAVLIEQGEAADQYQRMSKFVTKVGGGNPDRHVVKKFFARVDKDPQGWYPGKAAAEIARPVGRFCRYRSQAVSCESSWLVAAS